MYFNIKQIWHASPNDRVSRATINYFLISNNGIQCNWWYLCCQLYIDIFAQFHWWLRIVMKSNNNQFFWYSKTFSIFFASAGQLWVHDLSALKHVIKNPNLRKSVTSVMLIAGTTFEYIYLTNVSDHCSFWMIVCQFRYRLNDTNENTRCLNRIKMK